MSDARPFISLLLGRQDRLSRELLDLREGQAQLLRISTRSLEADDRAVEANGRELAVVREGLAGLRREVNAPATEQAALAMRVEEARLRSARADRTLKERGVALQSSEGTIDTASAAGEPVFHAFGAIAHFERRLIAERTRDGIAAARAKGRHPVVGRSAATGPRRR